MPGIVVGVDGSANARNALAWAVSEAAARRMPLTVLTVHEISHNILTGRPVVLSADEDLLAAAKAAATELTDKVVSGLEAKPASIAVTAVNGFADVELLAAAEGADMLVLGARGGAQASGLAAHSPIGSVSNKVLHRAKCPVVVIPAAD